MRYYELMMVMPQLDEEGLSATLERVNSDIGERGGTVVRQQRWGGVRRLAYPIDNHNEASYVLTYLELEPQRASELEANLRVSEDVLRHLLLKIDSIPEVKESPPQPAAAEEPAEAAPAAEDAPVAADEQASTEEAPAEDATEAVASAEEPVAEAPAEAVAEAEDETAATAEDESPAPVETPEAQTEEENKEQEG